jgi:glycerol kinase
LAVGFWKDKSEIEACRKSEGIFIPKINPEKREELITGWKKAVQKARNNYANT